MKYRDPLKKILSHPKARLHWDRNETRPAVLRAFRSALQCRTRALGAEVYASEKQERIVYHTCKSRACPSCGYRRTVQWLRERWAALPEVPYKGITFSMPDVLWSVFRDNPSLASALPALAANIIQAWASARHGLRVGVIAVLHTFNGELEFNSHVHAMLTAGGYKPAEPWVSSIYYDRDRLMKAWQQGVIGLIRAALQAGQLRTSMTMDDVERMLTQLKKLDDEHLVKEWRSAATKLLHALTAEQLHTTMSVDQTELMLIQQEKLWWSINIQSFEEKMHFLLYAGRYASRPPIAQHRIVWIGERRVTFWFKNKRFKSESRSYRIDQVHCSPEEFIDRWAQHIPERYQHGVRSFGLFAPRALGRTSAAIFAILGQQRRPRPKSRRWAESVRRDFGHDPLLDYTGQRMKWVR